MLERGSFIDQWERRDVLDPRDLVPVVAKGLSPRVVVYDLEGFRQIVGEMETHHVQVREEVSIAA